MTGQARAVITTCRAGVGSSYNATLTAGYTDADEFLAAVIEAIKGGWTVTIEPDTRRIRTEAA